MQSDGDEFEAYQKLSLKLSDQVKIPVDFSKTKDESIAEGIRAELQASDEISELSNETALMIHEIDNYTKSLLDKNNELLEAQEKIRAAIGVAYYDPKTDHGIDDVFKRADADMYRRKKEMKAARE